MTSRSGFARENLPVVAVSVPSGSYVQPRNTSRSSSNAPQRASRTCSPRTLSGHQARSARYRTASLFRPVSLEIFESSGYSVTDSSKVYEYVRYIPYRKSRVVPEVM